MDRTTSPGTDSRSYPQYCPVARSLELVGERWTLLIVRDLLLGPKRFTDLQRSLSGIGPKVLSARLQTLSTIGIIGVRELPPPSASTVYELTALGEQLRPLVDELTRWGLNFLGTARRGESTKISWLMRTLEATFRADSALAVEDTYQFTIDGETVAIRIKEGRLEVSDGPAVVPDFVYRSDRWTFVAIGAGLLNPAEAVQRGLAHVEGDLEAGRRSIELLGPSVSAIGVGGGLLGLIQDRLSQVTVPHELTAQYEIKVGEAAFSIEVSDGIASALEGAATAPAARLETDLGTLLAVGLGRISANEAIKAAALVVSGSRAALERFFSVLGLALDGGSEDWR